MTPEAQKQAHQHSGGAILMGDNGSHKSKRDAESDAGQEAAALD